jgi:hypothetical protein
MLVYPSVVAHESHLVTCWPEAMLLPYLRASIAVVSDPTHRPVPPIGHCLIAYVQQRNRNRLRYPTRIFTSFLFGDWLDCIDPTTGDLVDPLTIAPKQLPRPAHRSGADGLPGGTRDRFASHCHEQRKIWDVWRREHGADIPPLTTFTGETSPF